MYQRLANAIGLPLITTLLMCWAVSAVVIVVALVLLLVGVNSIVGIVLFLVGAVVSFSVTTTMLRARADVQSQRREK